MLHIFPTFLPILTLHFQVDAGHVEPQYVSDFKLAFISMCDLIQKHQGTLHRETFFKIQVRSGLKRKDNQMNAFAILYIEMLLFQANL